MPSWPSFTAAYTCGYCTDCGGALREGQQIRRTSPAGHPLAYKHTDCANAPDIDQQALSQPLCSVCGLHHPGEC
jgi:hypothetical protein